MEESEIMAKKQFKAESKRLLDLMINSIYTHKEIFLRELATRRTSWPIRPSPTTRCRWTAVS